MSIVMDDDDMIINVDEVKDLIAVRRLTDDDDDYVDQDGGAMMMMPLRSKIHQLCKQTDLFVVWQQAGGWH